MIGSRVLGITVAHRLSLLVYRNHCSGYKLNTYTRNLVKHSSTQHLAISAPFSTTSVLPGDNHDDYNLIYVFPHIRLVRLTLRMKIYQTGFTLCAIPPSIFMYSNSIIGIDAVVATFGVASFAGVMLYVMSRYLQNTIGQMSLSTDNKFLKVAHLTFWGRRKDTVVPVEQIVPLSDLPDRVSDAYVQMCRYDSEEHLLLFLKYGGVRDQSKFKTVFGSLIDK